MDFRFTWKKKLESSNFLGDLAEPLETLDGFLFKSLLFDEGERSYLYNDLTGKRHKSKKGKLTIGVGFNIEDRELPQRVIYQLLREDIQMSFLEAREVIGERFDVFTMRQKAGVVNMVFNLGLPRFKQFKRTIAYLQDLQFAKAKESALKSLWAKQVKSRAERVTDLFLDINSYPM